ncbi:MAG: hypothetical protein KTR25_17640 [Myxococcales bacterium]|nr:hypothetical protein [Myxococcales bacterium]
MWVCILCSFVGLWPVGASAGDSAHPFEDCQTADEEALQKELSRVAKQALILDEERIADLVEARWHTANLGDVIDRSVAQAISEVEEEEDYLGRLWSTWSPAKAQELAEKVANKTFSAPLFTGSMQGYVEGLSEDLSQEVDTASKHSASVALKCIHTYLRKQHTQTIVDLFDASLQRGIADADLKVQSIENSGMTPGHTRALAGVGLVIGSYLSRRLIRQFVSRLTTRLVGRIAGRAMGRGAASLVPMVGWVLGAGMVVWELVDGGQGAFPHIEQALTSEEAKASLRRQITETAEQELRDELPSLATDIAEALFAEWLGFKEQIRLVLELAKRNNTFARLVEKVPSERFTRLSAQIEVLGEVLGEEGLQEVVNDGRFERLLQLPSPALEIVRINRSMADVFRWAALVGRDLDKVVDLEIYRYRKPDEISKTELEILISLDNHTQIAKLLAIGRSECKTLLAIPSDYLKRFLRMYSTTHLAWLAKYVEALPEDSRDFLVSSLYRQPDRITALSSEKMLRNIQLQENSFETLKYIFDDISAQGIWRDIKGIVRRDIHMPLIVAKYKSVAPLAVFTGGGLFVFLFLLFRKRR